MKLVVNVIACDVLSTLLGRRKGQRVGKTTTSSTARGRGESGAIAGRRDFVGRS
ncbi:unnamed protein product [Strongylus vulgaris]|uniref:Uncharacterized protein n=1 Tax=Strongylus vulgaris TaxID=40348 RepID=A0A3P7JZJ9_STRVU|nr:unnamed protein product [Strongylus vulgaris]